MRIKQNKRVIEESELDMTPMIDIVFQLLIFFLLSAKFIALEGQLSSYLPKDRGLQASFSKIEPDEVIFFLEWVADPVNDCLLYTSPSPRDRTRSRMPSSA